MTKTPPTDDFLALSQVLTGETGLTPALAKAYYDRLEKAGLERRLLDVLAVFRKLRKEPGDLTALVKENIVDDPELGPVAKVATILWFTSALVQPEDVGNPGAGFQFAADGGQEYVQGLVWDVIGAHPPALSGGYFGYWQYPPEN